MSRPRYIALCGAPESGKSTIAEYLAERYHGVIIDDGGVLRRACMQLYGAPSEDFFTQSGKAGTRTVCGRSFTNRQLLGDLGALLENFYGDQFMPEAAIASTRFAEAPRQAGLMAPAFFLFPSCRKNQGQTYLRHGGVVLEVVRPGYVPTNDFDHYDRDLVTHMILNNGTLEQLLAQADDFYRHLRHT